MNNNNNNKTHSEQNVINSSRATVVKLTWHAIHPEHKVGLRNSSSATGTQLNQSKTYITLRAKGTPPAKNIQLTHSKRKATHSKQKVYNSHSSKGTKFTKERKLCNSAQNKSCTIHPEQKLYNSPRTKGVHFTLGKRSTTHSKQKVYNSLRAKVQRARDTQLTQSKGTESTGQDDPPNESHVSTSSGHFQVLITLPVRTFL